MTKAELTPRILSAAAGLAIAIPAVWLGGLPFRLFAAAGGIIVFAECCGAIRGSLRDREIAFAAMGMGIGLLAFLLGRPEWAAGIFVASALASAWIERAGKGSAWLGAVILYAGAPCLALGIMRGDGIHGFHAVLFVFVCVWSADICAYFAGKAIGGPKLAPSVSPNKTWAGFIASLAGAVLFGSALAAGLGYRISPFSAALALGLGLASTAGDLIESKAKRHFGVKDSGALLPGHGGLTDRVDGLIFASILAWAIGSAMGGSAFDFENSAISLMESFGKIG